MTKEMIISSTSHETRVAILEDDQVVEIFIEREQSRGVVGNVYKGRVSKVLPGMQSAFVDLGLERDAFLYVTDVISPTEEALEDDDDERVAGGVPTLPVVDPADELSAVDATPGIPDGDAVPVAADANDAESSANGSSGNGKPNGRGDRRGRERTAPTAKIEVLVRVGQEVVVQVFKEPLGT